MSKKETGKRREEYQSGAWGRVTYAKERVGGAVYLLEIM